MNLRDFMIEKFKLVIFDLDGTLVQSHKLWDEARAATLEQNNIPYIQGENEKIERGLSLKDFFKSRVAGLTDNELRDYANQTNQNMISFINAGREIEITEGAYEFIYFLIKNKIPVALVSNSERAVGLKILESVELQHAFDFMIFGDEVKNKKPDPEIFITALSKFKVAPKDTLVFEDSVVGAEASVKAGIRPIIIWDVERPETDYPDEVRSFERDFEGFDFEYDEKIVEQVKKAVEELRSQQN